MAVDQRTPVVVVGAGLAGLACAAELLAAGVPVRIRERSRVPGGRLASRRFDGRPADLGAAYFTVDHPGFAHVVDGWRAAGQAREWTDTFHSYECGPGGDAVGPPRPVTGPMRWAAPGGLRSLAERLAAVLPVAVDAPVERVEPGPLVDGEPARAVVLAMPGPQAARLLDPRLGAAVAAAGTRDWSPALAVVLRYAGRDWTDFDGAFVNHHPVLSTVCDDGARRGDGAAVLVAHTTAEFARQHLAAPTAAGPAVDKAVRDLLRLPRHALDRYVHRWTYAHPSGSAAGPTFHLDGDGVGLAGDAFGRPRVQTAWLSGRDLGRALVAAGSGADVRAHQP
nr:FAD-dependent oxidoreductase [Micromonospora sp. DSM 115978]